MINNLTTEELITGIIIIFIILWGIIYIARKTRGSSFGGGDDWFDFDGFDGGDSGD